jgi:hypothetical protein
MPQAFAFWASGRQGVKDLPTAFAANWSQSPTTTNSPRIRDRFLYALRNGGRL